MVERLPASREPAQGGYANAVDEECTHEWKWIPNGGIYQCERCSGIVRDPSEIDDCFITTAVHGHNPTLESLRDYRDEAMAAWAAGRVLIEVYERVSPPIAATLRETPNSVVTRWIRWVVLHCGNLADRHAHTESRALKTGFSVLLVTAYILCLVIGCLYWLLGPGAIRDAE